MTLLAGALWKIRGWFAPRAVTSEKAPRRFARLRKLEDRCVLSASPVDWELPAGAGETLVAGDHEEVAPVQDVRRELIFVDAGVHDYQRLLTNLPGRAEGRSLTVIVLEPGRDGIEQVTETLARHRDVDAVHFVTHGSAGAIQIGSTRLDPQSLARYAAQIQSWRHALRQGADLLFYSCDVAATAQGQGLLRCLGELTGADVAGSTDRTGDALHGGNWVLEFHVGAIETALPFAETARQAWHGALATYTVTNNKDSGPGSLRQAILNANGSAGLDTITFAIGSGVQTISPKSALPVITDPVVLDATTQPGWSNQPIIVLNGSQAGANANGLLITAGNSTVRGLVIANFSGSGIELTGGGGNLIAGNYIGTDVTGSVSQANGGTNIWNAGLLILDSPNNIIGGTTAAARNVISGNNYDGLDIENSTSTGNLVEGNYIGTDATGTTALANGYAGVWLGLGQVNNGIGPSNNTIGGTTAGAGNVLSGNWDDGIEIKGSTTTGNVVQGNLIGTDATGTVALGNYDPGVSIVDSPNNTIGGTAPGAGNVIAGSLGTSSSVTGWGISIDGSHATGNVIQGNFIGTDRTGTLNLGNALEGIYISDNGEGGSGLGFPSNTTIGGTIPGAGNTIAHNGGPGIAIFGGSGDAIESNSIFANAGLGIDLGGTGLVTPNTGTENPALPNAGMNYPVFTLAVQNGTTLTVSGYVGSAPGQAIFAGARIDVYASTNDPSGHGQGKTYLGFLTADASGNFLGSLNVSGLSVGGSITATATDAANNTSEYAANTSVTSLLPSSTTIVSSLHPSRYGQAVTFTATVSAVPLGLYPPTGTVTFQDGATILGTVAVSGGTAAFTTSALSAGSHTITATYSGDLVLASSTSSALIQNVTPAPLTVTANNSSRLYGQANPVFSVSYSGFVNGDSAASLGGSLAFATPATAASPIGSYTLTPSGLTSSNYTITYVAGTLNVTATPLLVTASNVSKVYGQANPALSATITGFVNGDTIAVVSGSASLSTAATAGSGAGAYTISVAQGSLSAANYTFILANGTFTITPAILTVTANDASKVYGQANPAFTDTITGFVNGDTIAMVSGAASLTTTATTGSGVGTYAITGAQGSLSAANYAFAFGNGTLTINPALLTVTATNTSKVYGQANPAFSAALTGFVNGDSAAVVSGAASLTTAATTGSAIGAYSITAAQGSLSAANYTFAFVDGTLTVNPAILTVAASDVSRSYGQANPALSDTIAGFVNGDSAVVVSGSASLSTGATTASGVGVYTIAVGQGSLSAANYIFALVNGTLTIAPAVLTVTADDMSKVYGQANPAFTDTISGFVNGDSALVVSGSAGLSSSATAGSGVGTYAITAAQGSLSAANYTFAFQSGTLTVTPATLIVTANDTSKVYGQANPAFTATITGFAAGDTVAVISGSASLTSTATAGSGVGSYTITAAQGSLSAANYTFAFANGTLSVTQAPLNVTANDATKVAGQPNPAFTASYSGFVNGDTASSLAGTLSLTSPATTSSPAGTYAITPSGLTSSNYAITFVNGTLTVTAAGSNANGTSNNPSTYGQTVTFAASVSAVPPATGTPTGTVTFMDGATSLGTVVLSGGSASFTTSALAAGSHSITIHYSGDSHFAPSTSPAFIQVVNPAPLTVTAHPASKVYGQANPAFSATITGFVNGDTAAVVSGSAALSTTATAASGVGTYAITVAQGSLSAANYSFAFVNGALTVTPASLTVTASDASKVYGQANPTFSDTITGFVNGDSAAVVSGTASLTTTATTSSGVGTYAITAAQGSLSAANYTFTFTGSTLTVNPAILTVNAADTNKVYGQANPVFSDTITGFVNGDSLAVVSGTASLTTAATAGSGVGTYTIAAAQGSLSATNYTFAFQNGSLTINPATLTVTPGDVAKVYGQPNPTFSATITGFVNGDSAAVVGGSASLSTTATASSGVGTYTITTTLGTLSAANYTFVFANGTLTINPARLTVTANSVSKIYGQANPPLSATITGFVNGDNSAVLSGSASLSTTATTASGVGAYTITATQASLSAANYTFTFANGLLTVNPATLTVTADDTSKIYGQANPPLSATITGFTNGDSAAVVSGAASLSTAATSSSGVGTYTIAVGQGSLSAANYTFTFANGILTVNPATLSVTANDVSKLYGQANPLLSATLAGFVNGDSAAVVSGAASLSTAATSSSGVGTYMIAVGQGSLSAANYTFTFANGTLTINPAPLIVTANNAARVYGQANPVFSATFSGFVNGDTAAAVSGAATLDTAATASSGVGAYAIAAAQGTLSAANYTFAFADGTLTIAPAVLTMTANDASKVYGQANPVLSATITGLVNGDTLAVVSGAASLSTSATAGSGVGAYTITAGPGSLSAANYAFAFANGTLSITPATLTVTANDASRAYGQTNPTFSATITGFVNGDTTGVVSGAASLGASATAGSGVGVYTVTATQGSLSAANYAFAFVNGTLTVNSTTLTVTANSVSKVYGQLNPSLSATITGFVNGDTAAVVGGAASLSTTATTGSGVGTYAITAAQGSLSAANYTFAFVNGLLTINPATLTVTADDTSKIYGQANPPLSATITGFTNGDSVSVVSGIASLSTAAMTSSGVGTYTITAAQGSLGAANYTFTFVNGILAINPATLTVTASDPSKVYGQANPPLSATLTGFVNGDTAAVVSGAASLSSAATIGSGVGAYTITATAGSLSAANYIFQFQSGTLTITPALLTVTANNAARLYGQANPAFSAAIAGFVNADTTAVLSGAASLSTTATAGSGVGTYTITAGPGSLSAANYTFAFANGTLTVAPAVLTVTPNDASKVYGQANPVLSATITGFANGDAAAVVSGAASVSTTASDSSGVGAYTITAEPGSLSAANYTFAFANGTLTITPATLTVTANDASKVYGQANPAFSATVSGFVNGDSASVLGGTLAFNTPATPASSVGSYAVTPYGLTAGNYTIHYADGTLTITPAALTVTANDATRFFGAANPIFSVSYSGFVNGDSALGGSLGFATAATVNGPVGSYAITPSGLSSVNYTITFADGTLTITTAPPPPVTVAGSTAPVLPVSGAALPPVAHASGPSVILRAASDIIAPTSAASIGAPSMSSSALSALQFIYVPMASDGNGVVPRLGAVFGSTYAIDSSAAWTFDWTDATHSFSVKASGNNPVVAFAGDAGFESVLTVMTLDVPLVGVSRAITDVPFGWDLPQVESVSALSAAHSGAGTNARPVDAAVAGGRGRGPVLVEAPEGAAQILWGMAWVDSDAEGGAGLGTEATTLIGAGLLGAAGFLLLNPRVGSLLLSLLTSRPAWRPLDPLEILYAWEQEHADDEDEETLQSLVAGDTRG